MSLTLDLPGAIILGAKIQTYKFIKQTDCITIFATFTASTVHKTHTESLYTTKMLKIYWNVSKLLVK